jgi:hypothetical protein
MNPTTPLPELPPEVVPDLTDIVTKDDTPVDSIFAEKQQRLLTEPLWSSWPVPAESCPFLALANVGLFYQYGEPPFVPDAMLALRVSMGANLHLKENHSYFVWLQGKPPDVAIEIVSDRHGGEDDYKLRAYARIAVPFYVIYDPENLLRAGELRAFALQRTKYVPTDASWLPEVGLGLKQWEGVFEAAQASWLRWCNSDGQVIPTGAERAEAERQRAEAEHQRFEAEQQRAERMLALLREHGIEPPPG